MFFSPLVILGQAIALFFSSILFGRPNLISFIKTKNTSNTQAVTTNTCTATCGTCAYVTSVGGQLYPPQYPDFYSLSYDCVYNIVVPTGKTATIFFPFGVISAGDSVTIYDGNSTAARVVAIFTDQNTASKFAFTSTSNTLTLEFKALEANQGGIWGSNYIIQ